MVSECFFLSHRKVRKVSQCERSSQRDGCRMGGALSAVLLDLQHFTRTNLPKCLGNVS